MKNLFLYWQKFSKNEKILFLATFALLAGALLYSFGWERVRESFAPDRRVEAKTKTLLRNAELLSAHPDLKARYDRLLSTAGSAAAPDEAVAKVLSEMEELARAHSIEVLSLKPQTVRRAGDTTEVVLEISAAAGADALARFLYEVEGNERLLKVRRLTVLGTSSGARVLRCTILVSKILVRP